MGKILGPECGYVDLLNAETEARLDNAMKKGELFTGTPIRPSAAGKCTRELAYDLMEYHKYTTYEKRPMNAESHRLLNLGHHIETHLLKQFEILEPTINTKYKQQVLSFAYLETTKDKKKLSQWLEGSLDLVLWSEKYKCVADVKSKKDKFSAFFKTNWDETSVKLENMRSALKISESAYWVEDLDAFLEELNDPFFQANFVQLNLYANADFLIERGVDHACIIQYNKNDSRLREIRFKPSRALYDKIINKFQTALNAVEQKNPELAPRDYTLGNIKCAFCLYQSACWNGEDAHRAFLDTFPKKKAWPKDTYKLGKVGTLLEGLYETYGEVVKAEGAKKKAEEDIIKVMIEEDIRKVRFSDGYIYEIKRLKSPRERLELRRSKV